MQSIEEMAAHVLPRVDGELAAVWDQVAIARDQAARAKAVAADLRETVEVAAIGYFALANALEFTPPQPMIDLLLGYLPDDTTTPRPSAAADGHAGQTGPDSPVGGA